MRPRDNLSCPTCAKLIEERVKAPPAVSLLPMTLYGAGAALAGFLICAIAGAIAFESATGPDFDSGGLQHGRHLAIPKGSKGRGGRLSANSRGAPDLFRDHLQLHSGLINEISKSSTKRRRRNPGRLPPARPSSGLHIALGQPFLIIAGLATRGALPVALHGFLRPLLNLAIIFFGLQKAWKLTRSHRPPDHWSLWRRYCLKIASQPSPRAQVAAPRLDPAALSCAGCGRLKPKAMHCGTVR